MGWHSKAADLSCCVWQVGNAMYSDTQATHLRGFLIPSFPLLSPNNQFIPRPVDFNS